MKIKNRILSILILAGLILFSCDQHLEEPPVSGIASSSYWQGEDDLQSYLFGIYTSYRGLTNTDTFSEERADLLDNGPQAPKLNAEFLHTLSAGANGVDWRSWYTTIHHTNLLLHQINLLEANVPDIKAQAHLFRAMTYFKLVRIFGEVPLVLDPTLAVPSNDGLPRSGISDVMAQIKSDIDAAIGLFSSDAIGDRNLLSKPAAFAIKADVYMWSGRFLNGGDADINMAIQAINSIESSGGNITLLSNYSDIFDAGNEGNTEIIFATYYDQLETGSNYFSGYGVRQDYLGGVGTIAAEYPDVPHSGNTGLNQVVFSPKLEAYYAENAGDVRADHNLYYIRKASNNELVTTMASKFLGTWDGTNRIYDNDLIQYRWADMLLLRAEAYNALSSPNTSGALSDLNLVRNRAGIGDYSGTTDQSTLEDEILKERARELCWENKRWEDLIRAGKVSAELPNYATQHGTDMRFIYWPIDLDIIAQNSQLIQTDGY